MNEADVHLVTAEALTVFLERLYQAKGASAEEAATVVKHQVGADLAGHASHGVTNTAAYVAQIDRGEIVPGADFSVQAETPTTAVVDGGWGFGFVQTERAMDLAVTKARHAGISAVTIRYQGHVGRLGAYAEMAAGQGMVAFLAADSGRGPKVVAPFGGRHARLGTNPICVGIPGPPGQPVILDMATSTVAVGKVALALGAGQSIPAGWILDWDGQPSTDPAHLFSGGALLPLGGDQGHKGYGLAVVVEILCGLLTGLGFGVAPDGRHNDGIFLTVFDVNRFRPREEFVRDVDDFVGYLKGTPTVDGLEEVFVPGELERSRAAAQLADGIPLAEHTWRSLLALAVDHGIDPPPTCGQ